MIYRFQNFTLDTNTSKLSNQHSSVTLNSKPFYLLKALLERPGEILDKDYLIKTVWHDRIVSDNTISQTVAQLRQILNDDGKKPTFIKTHRGRGLSFIPKVKCIQNHTSNSSHTQEIVSQSTEKKPFYYKLWVLTTLLLASIGIILSISFLNEPTGYTKPKPLLIFPERITDESYDWLQHATTDILTQSLDLNTTSLIRELDNTNENIDNTLQQQWYLSPHIQTVKTDIKETNNGYQLTVTHIDQKQVKTKKVFSSNSLKNLLTTANHWLQQQLDLDIKETSQYHLPENRHALELYMHGLAEQKKEQYTSAQNYFELSLKQAPDFHMASIELAKTKTLQDEYNEALILLESLPFNNLPTVMQVQVLTLQGKIFNTTGDPQAAQELLESTLKNYAYLPQHRLNKLRFQLHSVYLQLDQPEKALKLLNQIESTNDPESNPSLQAGTLAHKGRIFLMFGQTDDAEKYAKLALDSSIRINKLTGVANTHGLLGRIYSKTAEYQKAKYHLFESLNITRQLQDKLNIGATINELTYILIREGNFSQTETLLREMEEIALEIEHPRMLLAAKQHMISLVSARKNWQQAMYYLKQHEELAHSANIKVALTINHLKRLEILIEQGKTEGTEEIIKKLDKILNDTQRYYDRIALELRRAQIHLLNGNQEKGIELLIAAKQLALDIKGYESIIEINNTLAKSYLLQQPQKALDLLSESDQYQPIPYPFLLIKSKAMNALKQKQKAIELAIQCKQQSGDWWDREDEAYLQSLQ